MISYDQARPSHVFYCGVMVAQVGREDERGCMMTKKPKGKIGPIVVSMNTGHPKPSFEQVEFPEGKDDIEFYIVDRFIFSANKRLVPNGQTFFLFNPQKNKLDDFDFLVSTPSGPAYLELMEVAPLEGVKGGYSGIPPRLRSGEFAQKILRKILEKSNKYPKNLDKELFLLLYVTHWPFNVAGAVISLLWYYLSRENLVFRDIFLYNPLDQHEGEVLPLYPIPPDWIQDMDPQKLKDYEEFPVITFDPGKFELITSKKS